MLKKIGYGLLIALIAIQFIRSEKNIKLTTPATANDITKAARCQMIFKQYYKQVAMIDTVTIPFIPGMQLYNR